jgi:hypothetical protein
MDRKAPIERRQHKRFNAQDGAFALVKNHVSRLGQIIDVSMRGLAFKYIGNGKQSKGIFELDIFLSGQGIHSKNIPFKTVSDFEMKSEVPFSSIKMRRCCVQFGELTHTHVSQLKDFILNYTADQIR